MWVGNSYHHLESRWRNSRGLVDNMAPYYKPPFESSAIYFQHSVDFILGDILVEKNWLLLGAAAGPQHENHEVHFRMAVLVMKSFHSRERSEENWEPFKLNLPIHIEFVEKDVYLYTLQGINISHLGKRKIIFKMPFLGDMLVPWRVYYIQRFLGLPCCFLSQTLSDTFDSLHLGAWQKSCSIFLTFSDIHCEEIPPSKPPQKTSLPCPLVFWSHDFEPKIERNLRQNYFILKSASFNDHVLSFRHFGSSESIQTTKSVLGRLVSIPTWPNQHMELDHAWIGHMHY